MRNFEEIFNGLPEYVGDIWWQEHFAKRFEGTLKGSYHNVSSTTLRVLAEEMKEGLERASAEASDFISSVNTEGDITRRFEICSNLASEICPHIDIVWLSLEYYKEFNKWAVEKKPFSYDYVNNCMYFEDESGHMIKQEPFVWK